MKKLIIIGPPCVGKGTMSALLSAHYKIPLLMDNLSEHIKLYGTSLKYLQDIDYWTFLKQSLSSLSPDSGYIISSYPRSMTQLFLLEMNQVQYDFIIMLDQPEELIIQKSQNRKICLACNKSFCNKEFNFKQFYLKNISANVDFYCPHCGGLLVKRKDDTIRIVKTRFFQYTVFSEDVKMLMEPKKKLIFFELYKGVDDLDRLINLIDTYSAQATKNNLL